MAMINLWKKYKKMKIRTMMLL